MSVIILVCAVAVDYSRVRLAEPLLQRQVVNAIDVALMSYDRDLNESFLLYGIDDDQSIDQSIRESLDLTIGKSSQNAMYNFDVESIEISFGSSALSDKQVLKEMILENHSTAFATDQLVTWLERIEAFKQLDKVTAFVSKFQATIGEVSKLEDAYHKVQALQADYQAFAESASKIDLTVVGATLEELKESRADKEAAIDAHKDTYDNAQLDPELRRNYHQRLSKLREQLDAIDDDIDDAKDDLRTWLKQAKTVAKLFDGLVDLSNQLEDTLKKLTQLLDNVPKLSDGALASESQKVIDGIIKHVKKTVSGIAGVNQKINQNITTLAAVKAKVEKMVSRIDNFLDGSWSALKRIKHVAISDLSLSDIAIDILNLGTEESEFRFKDIMIGLWDMTFGGLMAQVGYEYGEIPRDIYDALPSRAYASDDIDLTVDNRGRSTDDMKSQIESNVDQQNGFLEGLLASFAGNVDAIAQKMTIVDYAMTRFNYNDFNGEPADGNNYIPDVEVEYLLSGLRTGGGNAMASEAKIFAMRFLLNGSSILAFKQTELNNISAHLAAMSGGFSYPVIYGLILAGWSGLESTIDLSRLKDNKKVVFFKLAKDIQFDLSLEKIANFKKILGELKGKQKTIESPLALNYRDYLFLMLVVSNEDKLLARIQDLIVLRKDSADFALTDMHTEISVVVDVSIATWFDFIYSDDAPHSDNGRHHYRVEIVRGYWWKDVIEAYWVLKRYWLSSSS